MDVIFSSASSSVKNIYKGEIQQQISAPHSQSQNGVAERYMGIVGNSSNAMMLRASMPQYDWPHAVNHATVLINGTTTKGINNSITPNEAYDGVKRKLNLDGVFGCLCFAKVFVKKKEDPKARRCVNLGFSTKCKAWIVRELDTFSRSLMEFYSRDVAFNVDIFPYRNTLVPRPVVPPVSEDDDELGDYDEVPFYLPSSLPKVYSPTDAVVVSDGDAAVFNVDQESSAIVNYDQADSTQCCQ